VRKNSSVPPGRPGKLTPALGDRLVELLAAGASTTGAAAQLGISRRTVQVWRARAWSRQPQDRPYVELERRIQCVLPPQTRESDRPPPPSWEQAAQFLEHEHAARWSLDDALDELDDLGLGDLPR
jgi:Homeodomain-like domain